MVVDSWCRKIVLVKTEIRLVAFLKLLVEMEMLLLFLLCFYVGCKGAARSLNYVV